MTEYSHVVSGLVDKRATIAGMIDQHLQEIKRLGDELHHLDATIKLFAADYDLRTIRSRKYRKVNVFFKPGERTRLVLDVLRESGRVLTIEQVAMLVIRKKGVDETDREVVALFKKAAITALRQQANRGLILCHSLAPDGITLQWSRAV